MQKISLKLTPKHRIDIALIRARSKDGEHLFPEFSELRRLRSGSRLSRIFRNFFSQKRIQKTFGVFLGFALVTTSLVSPAAEAKENFGEGDNFEAVISIPDTPLTTEKSIQFPLREVKINQGFRLFHPGVDFEGNIGDTIYPIKTGVIEKVESSRFGYGNSVIIRHTSNMLSRYAHLSEINVVEGQEVDMYTKIGEVGSTGRSTGSHLHLEIHVNGTSVNPLTLLPLQ